MPDLDPASPAFVKDRRSRIPRRDPFGEVRDDALFGLLLVVFDRFKNRTEVLTTVIPRLDVVSRARFRDSHRPLTKRDYDTHYGKFLPLVTQFKIDPGLPV